MLVLPSGQDLWVQAPAMFSHCSQNTVVLQEGDKTKNSFPNSFLEKDRDGCFKCVIGKRRHEISKMLANVLISLD